MNILALDTAGTLCSVAIYRSDGLSFLRFEDSVQSHSRHILPMLAGLLQEASIQLSDLHLLAWNAGPGSFTGLRIAASVVQSLSYTLQIPFLSLSSLEILARAAMLSHREARIFDPEVSFAIDVAMDARMNGIYYAGFVCRAGVLERIAADQLVSKDDFAVHCVRRSDDSGIVTGDAWQSVVGACPPTYISMSLSAKDVLALALTKPRQDWLSDPAYCLPQYVQPATNWQKRQRLQGNQLI